MSDYTRSPTAAVAISHSCDEEEDESAGLLRSSSGGGDPPYGGSGGRSASGRKPRGRPPGSKNKPKPPVVITRDSESSMHPVVLELAAGSDILESVACFAHRRRVGVSIIGGSGAVSSVTLRQPATSTATFTISGRFDILSLSGTFLPNAASGCGASAPCAAFTISLAGARGEVIGGVLAGVVTAAGPVVVVGASFVAAEFQRLPMSAGEEEGDGEDQPAEAKALQAPPAASSAAVECLGKQFSTGQMPHDMVMWAVPASSRSICAPHLPRPPSHY